MLTGTARENRRLNRRGKAAAGTAGGPLLGAAAEALPAASEPPTGQAGGLDLTLDEVSLPATGVRQTLILATWCWEKLRDYVHQRKARGQYLFSQRQAVEEALERYFAALPPVPPRPPALRELERQRQLRRKQGACQVPAAKSSPGA